MAFATYELFDFDVNLELSTRPEQRVGTDEMWDRAEEKLMRTLEELGLEYELNPGDGAFYGPKIDMHMTDSLGRSWQLGTVQLTTRCPRASSSATPARTTRSTRPVMIHRAMFGSYERFIGIMIEHYAGELPLWLAPVQAIVLPVSDRFNDYAGAVRDSLLRRGSCASSSTTAASRSGARSATRSCARSRTCWSSASASRADGTVSVREHHGGDLGSEPTAEFAQPPARTAIISAHCSPANPQNATRSVRLTRGHHS